MAVTDHDGNSKTAPGEVLKCWKTHFEKHLNTNCLRSEEALDDMAPGADGMKDNALKAGGEKMAEMLVKYVMQHGIININEKNLFRSMIDTNYLGIPMISIPVRSYAR